MNKIQKEINSKITKQKNDINRIKKETKEIEKLIYKEIENYLNLNKKDKDLAIKTKTTKIKKHLKIIKIQIN